MLDSWDFSALSLSNMSTKFSRLVLRLQYRPFDAVFFSSLVFGDHFIHSYNCRMQSQDCHRIRLVVPPWSWVHCLEVNVHHNSRIVTAIFTSKHPLDHWNVSLFGRLPKVWIRTRHWLRLESHCFILCRSPILLAPVDGIRKVVLANWENG